MPVGKLPGDVADDLGSTAGGHWMPQSACGAAGSPIPPILTLDGGDIRRQSVAGARRGRSLHRFICPERMEADVGTEGCVGKVWQLCLVVAGQYLRKSTP